MVIPSSAQEAYDLIGLAIAADDPVIFLEPKRSYWLRSEVDTEREALAIGRARVLRAGTALTLVTYGGLVPAAMAAADACAEDGVAVEVIDLRSLSPIDDDAILRSVERTGRLLITHEAPKTAGLGAEIAARVQAKAFYSLQAPVGRVTGYDTPYPASRLEEDWLPGVDRILDGIDEVLAH